MQALSSSRTRVERRRLVDAAWQRYVQDGIEPAGVPDEISNSWQRAREFYRIDPGIVRPTRVLSVDRLEERRLADEVFRIAAPILHDFAARLGLVHQVLAYLDAEGWMLSIDGHQPTVDTVSDIEFRPGANWAEESAGTNGPGTALASGKPVEIFASEHFVSAWHPWTCAASPIYAPGQSSPVGLVDITGPWQEQPRHAIEVARAIARAVEERLRVVANLRDEVVRYAFRAAHEGGDAVVALDSLGRVIASNDAAARRRVVESGSLARPVQQAMADLFRSRALHSNVDSRIETPEGSSIVTAVQYEGTTVGAILRMPRPPSPAPTPVPRAAPRAGVRSSTKYDFTRIVGNSEQLRRAVELARIAAGNDLPVVIAGESGTGKELFAQSVHASSARAAGRFVAVNCGSIPSQLVEAELFGYESGTFTGGRREGSAGRFEDANGGTIFLDEVSELSMPAQTALLRVLQEKEVVRLGSSTPRPLDVRVIAATNKPLDEEIRAKRFRKDLFYRLNVLPIAVPPLRDRAGDVILLAELFRAEAELEVRRSGLSFGPDAIAALRAHRWPGNVRELKNVILRAAAMAPAQEIGAADLLLEAGGEEASSIPSTPAATPVPSHAPAGATLREAVLVSERDVLLQALESCSWNIARAAQQLDVSRMTLYRRLRRCGIVRDGAARSDA
jgi:transcriptional regulator of acetoin/glycerol metabolism